MELPVWVVIPVLAVLGVAEQLLPVVQLVCPPGRGAPRIELLGASSGSWPQSAPNMPPWRRLLQGQNAQCN